MKRLTLGIAVLMIGLGLAACATEPEAPATADVDQGKIPITSASEEAVRLYLEGRALGDGFHGPDAREKYSQAVALDDGFALAHLGLANTSPTAQEFFDSLGRAVTAAGGASDGERWMVLAQQAGSNGDPTAQGDYLRRLVEKYPSDERALNLLATYHFGRQEYAEAIARFTEATQVNPDYSTPYNLLGYAQRTLGNVAAAEEAFKKYIALLPDEPNPYDSYAELLMKLGRFEESIANYEKALARDEGFVASYVGIGNNQIFMGQSAEARATFQKLQEVARNDGQRRQSLFWAAASYLHEGEFDQALAELAKRYEIAAATDDKSTLSGDLNLMGNVLLEKGDPQGASAKFREAVEMIEQADVSDDVKEGTRRNHVYLEARAAVATGDLETATGKLEEYRQRAAVKSIPFELRRTHELAGVIALHRDDYDTALTELEQANQQDPRVLYLQALACQGKGDEEGTRQFASRAASFNQLNLNLAYVRARAQKLAAT